MKHYSIQSLAKLSGVTTRTLRHYHHLGLLVPESRTEAGYRLYTSKDADTLQQILLHKRCGFDLETIKQILTDPRFGILAALANQEKLIQAQQLELAQILKTIQLTIKHYQGDTHMSDDQKFMGLKTKLIADNDQKYGDEVKQKWGEDAWKKSNQHFKNLTQAQFDAAAQLEKEFKDTLSLAFATHNPAGELASKSVDLHQQWLQIFWPEYSKDAHLGVAKMYLDDPRFHHWFGGNKDLVEFFYQAVSTCRTK